MMKDMIRNYFLDKPGTFEDEEDHKHITLNLASENIVEIKNTTLKVKLDKQTSKQIASKFKDVKFIKSDGQFDWNEIPMDDQISMTDLFDVIDHSYESAMDALPEHEQKEIFDLEW